MKTSTFTTRTCATAAAATAACVALTLFSPVAGAAGQLVINPTNSNATVGTNVVVQVQGQSFSDAVVGGGFNLSFDPAVLSLTSVAVNTAVWEFISSPGSINNVAGTLSDTYFNSFAAVLPTGNFPVATLTFMATGVGNTALSLSASPSFPFANALAETIAVTFGGAQVNVSVVPEPAGWALWLLGAAALPLWQRRWARR